MSLKIENVKLKDKDVKRIYMESFSKEERMPFALMVVLAKMANTDFMSFYDEDILCGFVYMATFKNITYVLFFAVDKNIRSKGYGSKILNEIQKKYSDNKIIVSIERCDVEAENIDDRIRRKNFYFKNGFSDSGYLIELSKIEQEILIKNGDFNKDDFEEFLKIYSNGVTKPKIWKK